MKNEKTIFEVLFKKEICFAVNVSLNRLDEGSRDYFIIVQEQDLSDLEEFKLEGFKFDRTDDYPNVFERDLSAVEISEFKANMDKFVEVKHNQFGRVYELKNNSFKKLHESILKITTMTKTKWVPKIDDLYYTIESDLLSSFSMNKYDIENIENGNYFQTPELRQQAIEMLKKAFHGYTLKKPVLFSANNELDELEACNSTQKLEVELIDKENNLIVFAKFRVDVCAETDGDDWNTPITSKIKWAKIFDLSFDICDENGDDVEDENDLIYNEVLTFLKDFYE